MCSIAGATNEERVGSMLLTMQHRAPDGYGWLGDKKFTIGMGRLAIIDLISDGLCPYREDEYILAFNGEIYNYKEIRRELQDLGWIFRTESDQEVLLKSYRQWGAKCLDKFNGMWAFAIYDGKTIFLARDLAGEKPLYYSNKPFAFASEAKALKWKCEEFPPASYGIYDFKTLKIQKWWEFKPRPIDPRTALEELDFLIEDSMRLRLRSDVPMGLYYSNGIDSSLLATYADFEHKYTYVDGDYKDEFLKTIPKIVWHLDYPSTSFSPFGQWKLAELASKDVRVVVTGEGADELFGGYVRYIPTALAYEGRKRFPSYQAMFASKYKDVNEQGWEEFQGNLRLLLRQNDRMASAFGLENRTPFLDRRIIEFAFSLPPEMKIRGFETKTLLRRLLERRNPFYRHIEKAGLYCSIPEWLGEKDRLSKKKYMALQEKLWRKLAK
jgi:asparagine synthase (glutamine-hydrolysing)